MTTQKFYPKIGWLSILITIGVGMLLYTLSVLNWYDFRWISFIGTGLLLIGMIIFLFYYPFSYIITNDKLILNRLLRSITISKKDIRKVYEAAHFNGAYIMAGRGMIFNTHGILGYLGRNSKGMISLATALQNNIVLEMKSGASYVISVENPKKMLNSFTIK